MSKQVIDSYLNLQEALADNPNNHCPENISRTLSLLEVIYLGFDGQEHAGQIVVTGNVAGKVKAFFQQALELKFPIEKVVLAADPRYQWDDQKLMADNATSGFNYRVVAGTNRISQHGKGLAIDVNTKVNPCIRLENGRKIVRPLGAIWDREAPGALYADHPLVRLMEGFGWEWGGNWTLEKDGIVDYQHFQKPHRS